MGLEKDTIHVVVRLPFKRPADFVEPPPVVWTDDMEHQLWKYMNQKHTDWNYIAEQLGVPTPYLVRHAAFMYETQLKGIHQQLRLSEVGKTSSPIVSTSNSSTTTAPATATQTNTGSYRPNTGNSGSGNGSNSRPSSQKQVRPLSSLSSSQKNQQQHNSTTEKHVQQQGDYGNNNRSAIMEAQTMQTGNTTPASTHKDTTAIDTTEPSVPKDYPQQRHHSFSPSSSLVSASPSTSSNIHTMPITATTTTITTTTATIAATAATAAAAQSDPYQSTTRDDSMILSAISNISPRNRYSEEADLTSLLPRDEHSIYASCTVEQQPPQPEDTHTSNQKLGSTTVRLYMDEGSIEDQRKNDNIGVDQKDDEKDIILSGHDSAIDEVDNDGGFSKHFEKMKLQLEEPAFLPSRRTEGSLILNSLRALPAQCKKILSPDTSSQEYPSQGSKLVQSTSSSPQPPSQPPRPPSSSSTSSSPSPSSRASFLLSQQQMVTEIASTSLLHEYNKADKDEKQVPSFSPSISALHDKHEDTVDDKTTESSNKTKMIFGPNLQRSTIATATTTATTSSISTTPTTNNITQPMIEEHIKETNSAFNSVGSSFSDLSDSSVTQSAMEDAFMSKLNNGSKMSSLAFSRKET